MHRIGRTAQQNAYPKYNAEAADTVLERNRVLACVNRGSQAELPTTECRRRVDRNETPRQRQWRTTGPTGECNEDKRQHVQKDRHVYCLLATRNPRTTTLRYLCAAGTETALPGLFVTRLRSNELVRTVASPPFSPKSTLCRSSRLLRKAQKSLAAPAALRRCDCGHGPSRWGECRGRRRGECRRRKRGQCGGWRRGTQGNPRGRNGRGRKVQGVHRNVPLFRQYRLPKVEHGLLEVGNEL